MPYIRRLPKRGFNNARFRTEYVPVNLSDLEKNFDAGATVDIEAIKTAGLANGGGEILVKILGKRIGLPNGFPEASPRTRPPMIRS